MSMKFPRRFLVGFVVSTLIGLTTLGFSGCGEQIDDNSRQSQPADSGGSDSRDGSDSR